MKRNTNSSMKSAFLLLVMALFSVSLLTSCKGTGGKKAATEALELIERKAAAKAGGALGKEGVQVERTAIKETESYTPSRSRRPRRPRHGPYDDDNRGPQVYTVQCSQCGGTGGAYVIDYYGNIQYDYYGNPLVSQCRYCQGTGVIQYYQ